MSGPNAESGHAPEPAAAITGRSETWALAAEELREFVRQRETLEGDGFEGGTYMAVESDDLRVLADRWEGRRT